MCLEGRRLAPQRVRQRTRIAPLGRLGACVGAGGIANLDAAAAIAVGLGPRIPWLGAEDVGLGLS